MKHSLSITYITARKEPRHDWFWASLIRQMKPEDDIELIIVDFYKEQREWPEFPDWIKHVPPKPSTYYGQHKITPIDWWGISSFRNTGLCLSTKSWHAVCDDRSVLGPRWLEAVNDAMEGCYAVAGAYEKVHYLAVENGQAMSCVIPVDEKSGRATGKDPRVSGREKPIDCGAGHFYGCTSAMPIEWALAVNGWSEECDMLGLEDSVMGMMLREHGYQIKFDERMMLIEDRTPEYSDCACVRTDKGKSPNDKSHALLKRHQGKNRCDNQPDLRAMRELIQRGGAWPIPDLPILDWYDSQPLVEMKVQ